MVTCFPSILPIAFGKFHFIKKSCADFSQISDVGLGIYFSIYLRLMASQTSLTIRLTVENPILNV